MPRPRRIKRMPVMKTQCASCPFGPNGDARTATAVLDRTLMKASQICHHPRLNGKPETHLCRGARDIQLKVLVAMGLLPEATDEAFHKKSKELGAI
jgi:hypothetical protein